MKDFHLRNETLLLFRSDPVPDLAALAAGKKTLFVYGGGSAKRNGCHADVSAAVKQGGGTLFELPNASRELAVIEDGIAMAKERGIELVIGAGGASVMDCAKLIAFGAFHADDLWDYVKGKKNPYGLEMLPLALMPTYPSSGSEYGLGAVAADARTGDFGTAYGIAADTAILVPKYALTLSAEMTAYTGLVTLVQLSAATLGDRNPVSYDIGVSVMKNVRKAIRALKERPDDLEARGVILYGAALSTSSRLGLGKESNYAYELYELEFIPEALFGAPYRKSLTTIFPRFLKAMAKEHEADIRAYFSDVFGFEGEVAACAERLVRLFEEIGVDMRFTGELTEAACAGVEAATSLSPKAVFALMQDCMNK